MILSIFIVVKNISTVVKNVSTVVKNIFTVVKNISTVVKSIFIVVKNIFTVVKKLGRECKNRVHLLAKKYSRQPKNHFYASLKTFFKNILHFGCSKTVSSCSILFAKSNFYNKRRRQYIIEGLTIFFNPQIPQASLHQSATRKALWYKKQCCRF